MIEIVGIHTLDYLDDLEKLSILQPGDIDVIAMFRQQQQNSGDNSPFFSFSVFPASNPRVLPVWNTDTKNQHVFRLVTIIDDMRVLITNTQSGDIIGQQCQLYSFGVQLWTQAVVGTCQGGHVASGNPQLLDRLLTRLLDLYFDVGEDVAENSIVMFINNHHLALNQGFAAKPNKLVVHDPSDPFKYIYSQSNPENLSSPTGVESSIYALVLGEERGGLFGIYPASFGSSPLKIERLISSQTKDTVQLQGSIQFGLVSKTNAAVGRLCGIQFP